MNDTRTQTLDEFVAENREWLKDWRDGQFDSGSRDKDGWPIEMHGLALALEDALDRLVGRVGG